MSASLPLLVVEDDDIVRMLTVEVLGELGYSVVEAEDGETALELLQGDQVFALLITDVGLPGIKGDELAAKARALQPTLPVLFASGYGENIDVPADMHLISKPFNIDQLRSKVAGILGPNA